MSDNNKNMFGTTQGDAAGSQDPRLEIESEKSAVVAGVVATKLANVGQQMAQIDANRTKLAFFAKSADTAGIASQITESTGTAKAVQLESEKNMKGSVNSPQDDSLANPTDVFTSRFSPESP